MGKNKVPKPQPVHHHKPSAKQNIRDLWVTFNAFMKEAFTPPPFMYVAPPLCKRALFCIPKTSFIRRYAIIIAHWKAFEYATLLAIVANCVTLALDSNAPGFYESELGRRLILADYAFTGFFTLEALVKMLAQGIIFAPNTYMRNAWNFLDLIIVATGYISLAGFANVTALRAIRALRPLRAITRIRNMKLIVSTLLTSTTNLLDMLVLTAFFLAIFGTMCVQLFGGQLNSRCGLPDFSDAYTDEQGIVQGVQYHVPDAEKGTVCRHPRTEDTIWTNTTDPDTGAAQLIATGFETSLDARDCPYDHPDGMEFGMYCTPFGNPGASGFGDLSVGYWSFDNILLSWVVIFQHMTMGNWAFIMYFTQDGVNWWTWILHFAITILGGMLLINLALAVIFMNYEKVKAETSKALEDARRQEELEEQAKVEFASVLQQTVGLKQRSSMQRSSSRRLTKTPSSAKQPVAESTTPDPLGKNWGKLRDLARMPLSLKRISMNEPLFTLNKSSNSFSTNSPGSSKRTSPGTSRRVRGQDSASGVRQRMAGPTDVDAWAVRLRARANWRKAGMLTLPNYSPAFLQLAAAADEAMQAAPRQLVQLSAWRYNTSGRVEAPKAAPKEDKKGTDPEGISELPAFPDLTDTSEDDDEEEFKPAPPSESDDSDAGGQQPAGAPAAAGSFVEKPMSWWTRKKKRIKKWCYKTALSPNFELSNALAICINAIVLGLNWYLMPEKMDFAMDLINYCFTVYFVIETNIRMIGLGPDLFFGTFMNTFGYVISLASLSEMIVALEPTGPEGAFNGALTTIRLLRLLKLARYWKGLKIVLCILGFAVRSGIYLLMLVLLFMFVMGLLGLQLFGHEAVFCGHVPGAFQTCPPEVTDCPAHRECFVRCLPEEQGQWIEVEHSPYGGMALCERFPRDTSSSMDPVLLAQVGKPERLKHHFDDMFHAFMTVFVIITLDNWTDIMFPLMSGLTPWVAIYFVFCVIIGAFMMLQLFLAILLSGLDELEQEIKAEQHSHSLADILKASSVGVAGRELSRSVMERMPGKRTPDGGSDGASRSSKEKKGSQPANQFLLDKVKRPAKVRTRTSVDSFAEHLSRIHSLKPGAERTKSSLFGPGRAKVLPQGSEHPNGSMPTAKQSILPPIFPNRGRGSVNKVSPAPLPQPPPSIPTANSHTDRSSTGKAGAYPEGHGQIQANDPLYGGAQAFSNGSPPRSPFSDFGSQQAVNDRHPHSSNMHSNASDAEVATLALPYLKGPQGIRVGNKDEVGGAKQAPQRNMSKTWTASGKQAPLKPQIRAAASHTHAAGKDAEGNRLSHAASGTMAEAAAAAAAAHAAAAAAAAAIARAEQSLQPSAPAAGAQDSARNSLLSPGRGSVSSSVDAPSTPSKHSRGSASLQSARLSVGNTSESSDKLVAGAAAAVAATSTLPSENQQQQQPAAIEPPAPQHIHPFSDPIMLNGHLSPVPNRESLQQHPHPHQQQQPGSGCQTSSSNPNPPAMILYPPPLSRHASVSIPLGSAEPLDPADWPQHLPGTTHAVPNTTQATMATVSELGSPSQVTTPWQVSREHQATIGSGGSSSQSSSTPSSSLVPQDATPARSPKSLLVMPLGGGPQSEVDDTDHPFIKELQTANSEDSVEVPHKEHPHAAQFAGVTVPFGDGEDDRGLGLRALGLGGQDRTSGQRVTPGGTRTYSEMLQRRKSSMKDREAQDDLSKMWDEEKLQGTACLCLDDHNWLRFAAARVIAHKSFEAVIIICCVASSVLLALDDVTLDRNSTKALVLRNLDASFTAVFGTEIMLKMLAMGVLFNGKNSYLRSGWNQVDTFVVAMSVIVLVVEATVTTAQGPWLRALRAARCLRVLRVSMKVPGVKVVVKALSHLIPSLFNTLAVGLLFFYIFAILSVALLNGRMHYCADEEDGEYIDPYYVLPYGETIFKDWCEATDIHRDGPRTITTSYYHSKLGVDVPPWNMTTSWTRDLRRFDNIFNALWVLYQMASVEGWSSIMYHTQMATEQEQQPIRDANKFIALFFMLFMFVSSFVVLNLIIGVSILKFNEMKDANDGQSPFLTPQQSQWLSVQHMLSTTQLETLPPPSANWFRRVFHLAIYNKYSDRAVVAIILANTFVMFLSHYGMGEGLEDTVNMTNLIVTIIFAAEMICKLIAIGIRPYFRSNWNCFDAFITGLSVLGVLLENLSEETVSFLPVLRALRVARIFRLIPRAKGLRKLLRTLYWSIPAVTNVAYVLFVFLYLWAIVGMNLWGNIKLDENSDAGINRHANFRHFPVSMITEFRMITGENWNDVMQSAMIREDCLLVRQDITVSVTTEEGNQEQVTFMEGQYLDPVNDHRAIDALGVGPGRALEDQCSLEPFLAVLYFCSFMLFCSYILLQLVIGIILESIQAASLFDFLSIGPDDVQIFIQAWEKLDPQGTSYISVWQLSTLLSMIPPELGAKGMLKQQMHIVEIIYSTDIPLRNLKVHFMEVLHALAGRIAGAELPAEEELRIHAKLVKAIPQDPPKYLAAHAYAALAVGGAVRGFLHRRRLEDNGAWEKGAAKTPRISLNGSVSCGVLQPKALDGMSLQERLHSRLEGPAGAVRQQRLKIIEETNRELQNSLQQHQQQQQQQQLEDQQQQQQQQQPERPKRTLVGFAQGEVGQAEGKQPQGPKEPTSHAWEEQQQQLQQLQEQKKQQQQDEELRQQQQHQPQLPQQEQQIKQQQQQQQQQQQPQQQDQLHELQQQRALSEQHALPPLLPPLEQQQQQLGQQQQQLEQQQQQQQQQQLEPDAFDCSSPPWGGVRPSRMQGGEAFSRASSSQQSLGSAGPRSGSNLLKTAPQRPPPRLPPTKLPSIAGPRTTMVKLPPVKPSRLQRQQSQQPQQQAQRPEQELDQLLQQAQQQLEQQPQQAQQEADQLLQQAQQQLGQQPQQAQQAQQQLEQQPQQAQQQLGQQAQQAQQEPDELLQQAQQQQQAGQSQQQQGQKGA